MKISYAITVCNELTEVERLLTQLLAQKHSKDEIVVLYDNKGTEEVLNYLQLVEGIKLVCDTFDGHFADWKNKLTALCTGDFIFQIDADEYLADECVDLMHQILESNPEVDLYFVPRINTVSGLTEEHIQKWGWNVVNGRVNWPDYQTRIYKNNSEIKWKNKVHEVLEGYKTHAILPLEMEFSLSHHKDIERQ